MSEQSLTLTVGEIRDLARAAGLVLDEERSTPDDQDEAELTIEDCPAGGLDNEDGTFSHYRKVAYYTEYPEEGSTGLGERQK